MINIIKDSIISMQFQVEKMNNQIKAILGLLDINLVIIEIILWHIGYVLSIVKQGKYLNNIEYLLIKE